MTAILTHTYFSFLSGWILTVRWFSFLHPLRRFPKAKTCNAQIFPCRNLRTSYHIFCKNDRGKHNWQRYKRMCLGTFARVRIHAEHFCFIGCSYEIKTDSPFAALHSDCLSLFYILFVFLYRYACTIGRSRLAMIAARMQRI